MAEKSAELHTLAPRLSHVEDMATWLLNNREEAGGGGGGRDEDLWRITVTGAVPGAWNSDPWTAPDLIYGPGSQNGMSMHQTVFGQRNDAAPFQDSKGLAGWVFPDGENRWSYSPGQYNATLATDVFGGSGAGYVQSLRAQSKTLVEAIFKNPSYIGSSAEDSIIGRIEGVQAEFEEMWGDLTALSNYIDNQLNLLRARLAAGGL
jgi:hypothetical protein